MTDLLDKTPFDILKEKADSYELENFWYVQAQTVSGVHSPNKKFCFTDKDKIVAYENITSMTQIFTFDFIKYQFSVSDAALAGIHSKDIIFDSFLQNLKKINKSMNSHGYSQVFNYVGKIQTYSQMDKFITVFQIPYLVVGTDHCFYHKNV